MSKLYIVSAWLSEGGSYDKGENVCSKVNLKNFGEGVYDDAVADDLYDFCQKILSAKKYYIENQQYLVTAWSRVRIIEAVTTSHQPCAEEYLEALGMTKGFQTENPEGQMITVWLDQAHEFITKVEAVVSKGPS